MTDPSRRRFLETSGAAGVVALTGFAGCSSTGGTETSSTTTGSSSATDDPITIAATTPQTGKLASIGKELAQGYELGIAHLQETEPLGRPVEFVHADDQSDAQTAQHQLNKLLSNNDVDVILSSFSTLIIPVQARMAEEKEIPYLAVAQSYMKDHTQKDTKWLFTPFPMSRDHAASTKAVLDAIPATSRPRKVGIWQPNGSWSTEMADWWTRTLSDDYDIVLHETHQANAKDFSTLIAKTKSAGVEALLGPPNPVGGITAMKQIAESDYDPAFVEFMRAADSQSWHTALGENGTNVCMSSGWVPGMTGNGNAEMKRAYHDRYDVPAERLVPNAVGFGYNAVQVADQAVRAAGSTDAGAIQGALRENTFETVSGSFGFDDVGMPTGITALIGQWQDGNHHLVYPNTDGEASRDLVYPR